MARKARKPKPLPRGKWSARIGKIRQTKSGLYIPIYDLKKVRR